jgi:hypothetical protein
MRSQSDMGSMIDGAKAIVSVNLGFTPDMHCMFNGASVVTHELAPFVDVLDRGAFSSNRLATEMLRHTESSLTWATSRIYKMGEQFLDRVRPVVSGIYGMDLAAHPAT